MADMQQSIKALDELIEAHCRRLHQLQVREAIEGINTPPEVSIEIENIQKRVEGLEKQRAALMVKKEPSPNLPDLQKEREAIEAKAQETFEIKAAFENRDLELRTVLDPFSKPLIIITAPAGYGKTHLLSEIKRRLTDSKWLVLHHDCRPGDTEMSVLGDLIHQVRSGASVGDMNDFFALLNRSLENIEAEGVTVQFDSVEQWKSGNQWTAVAIFVQQTFASGFSEAMRLRFQRSKLFFAGRYISDFKNNLSIPYQEVQLSSFGYTVIRGFICEVLRRFETRRSQRLGFTPGDIDYLTEEVLDVVGGHPRAEVRLILDIGNKGFAIDLRFYFRSEHKQQLFNDFVVEEIENLFKGVPPSLQDVLTVLSVFRGFNGDTLNALLDSHYITSAHWSDGWKLYSQILKTHLVEMTAPLAQDRILQRVLDAQMRFAEPDRYRQLHCFAADLYDHWLEGKDHRGENLPVGVPTGTDQVKLMVESLYHACRSLTGGLADAAQLKSKVESFLPRLRFLGGQAQGCKALRQAIENDDQLVLLFKRVFGDYPALLEIVSPEG